MSGCVGLMTNDDAGKLYSAMTSPKAAWALRVMSEPLNHQIRPRTSHLGNQSVRCAFVLITCLLCCRSCLIWEIKSDRLERRNSAKCKENPARQAQECAC